MINANVQDEPATSYDVELAGQLAAIGIVHGKEFAPDERMKAILTDAAAVGHGDGTGAAVAVRRRAPGLGLLRGLAVVEHALGGRRLFRDPAAALRGRHVQAAARRPARARSIRARPSTTPTRSTARA